MNMIYSVGPTMYYLHGMKLANGSGFLLVHHCSSSIPSHGD